MWTWIKSLFGFGPCAHEWEAFEVKGTHYRGCIWCDHLEKFEPDVSGWTAGHWDKFSKPTFNHNHFE